MSCEQTVAYKDDNNRFHWTEEECCKANKEIKRVKHADEMVETYMKELHTIYKNSTLVLTYDYVIRDFLYLLAYNGYDIIKVRDYDM